MKDDVAAIRSVVQKVVEQDGGTEVLMVLHSAGGFLGSMAIEGLSVNERKAAGGQRGGVRRLVFVAGAVWEEGFRHGPLPFFEYRVSPGLPFSSFYLVFSQSLSLHHFPRRGRKS